MRKTFKANWWKSKEAKKKEEEDRIPMPGSPNCLQVLNSSPENTLSLKNKDHSVRGILNININNYYIQSLMKNGRKLKMPLNRTLTKDQMSKEISRIKLKIQQQLKNKENKEKNSENQESENFLIKKKVDKILKKYFMRRNKNPKKFTFKKKDKKSKEKYQIEAKQFDLVTQMKRVRSIPTQNNREEVSLSPKKRLSNKNNYAHTLKNNFKNRNLSDRNLNVRNYFSEKNISNRKKKKTVRKVLMIDNRKSSDRNFLRQRLNSQSTVIYLFTT